MTRRRCVQLVVALITLSVPLELRADGPPVHNLSGGESPVLGIFEGSTPELAAIRPLLELPPDSGFPTAWRLTLHRSQQASEPATFTLHCDNSPSFENRSAANARKHSADTKGTYTISKGIKSNPEATVYELNGLVALAQIDGGILQMLNPDRTLMVGDEGYSFTLNPAERTESPGDPTIMADQPSHSYLIAPIESGANVFGVFGGRTPYDGISREQKITNEKGIKAKWRITLYQNPETREPTRYRLEGTLYWRGAREGTWKIERGTKTDPNAIVYRLEPNANQLPVYLLQGDENVLFFLNQDRDLRVGHREFSYTLNRQKPRPPFFQ